MRLLEKWQEGGVEARVFTDRWPNCSCVVVLYREWVGCAADKNGIALGMIYLKW